MTTGENISADHFTSIMALPPLVLIYLIVIAYR